MQVHKQFHKNILVIQSWIFFFPGHTARNVMIEVMIYVSAMLTFSPFTWGNDPCRWSFGKRVNLIHFEPRLIVLPERPKGYIVPGRIPDLFSKKRPRNKNMLFILLAGAKSPVLILYKLISLFFTGNFFLSYRRLESPHIINVISVTVGVSSSRKLL
jgi:hypothetical protein